MRVALLAAGRGERLYPITENKPKPLVLVAGKPFIVHTLTNLRRFGLNKIIIITGKNKLEFRKTLETYYSPENKIIYIEQKKPEGSGHATSLIKKHVDKEPFLLIYGDIIPTESLIKRILTQYNVSNSNILVIVKSQNVSNFGVVEYDNDTLKRIVEKPRFSKLGNYVNAGIYIFNHTFFPFIKKIPRSLRNELELTDAINRFISSGGNIKIIKAEEAEWMHASYPWDLLDINQQMLKRNHTIEGCVEKNVSIKNKVIFEKGAQIKSGTVIEGPVYIGKDSIIGPNCYIRPYTTVGRRVKIGSACEIKNSIIMNGSKISHLSYLGDSILGEECNLGAGTIAANLRLDEKNIKMKIKQKQIDTQRKKLGVFLGDKVRTGVQVSLMPGIRIGCNTIIGPNTIVHKDIPSNSFVQTEFKFKLMPTFR